MDGLGIIDTLENPCLIWTGITSCSSLLGNKIGRTSVQRRMWTKTRRITLFIPIERLTCPHAILIGDVRPPNTGGNLSSLLSVKGMCLHANFTQKNQARLVLESFDPGWRPCPPYRCRVPFVHETCMDIRANDDGDLVMTKGDQYDVREKEDPRALKIATFCVCMGARPS
ncbi:hypothetical protein BS47DRAFT_774398 [Hydnum rufescens UP504]|uniref:Uncharacterized protein n=1 Tax=Hydnum rufescens UP504 TaxID=1448309 RepID=A0A9P6B0Y9_9AGAM|nr:hypothetical protein BS47DRAFT_774398 [Hydnum rufescens UP504]